MKRTMVFFLFCMFATSCTMPPGGDQVDAGWVMVVHGGAGSHRSVLSDEELKRYEHGMRDALETGRSMLEDGYGALDVVERVITVLEDDPLFNAGRGAVLNHDGNFELDASIMDGSNLACGAVAGVGTVRNPIMLARKVMDKTNHVLLCADGAELFAEQMGMEPVSQEYFWTETRYLRWLEHRRESGDAVEDGEDVKGTVGAVVLDSRGHLAAGTSTGGLTGKKFGRIGDSPIIGAGTYADDETCAVSCTGQGEEYIRHAIAHTVSMLVQHDGMTLEKAAGHAIAGILEPDTGGLIAVGADGAVAIEFNTEGMIHGVADSRGRFEVGFGD